MSFEVNWESLILQECENPHVRRRDVAQTYRYLLEAEKRHPASVDWPRVNRAILARWSKSALIWIKEAAWSGRCFREKSDVKG